ncbi:hypothetical protein GCM10010272_04970 [Streptomyces lateritius]|nr:hypothetical protein GCM10010272_04970 [Streptomyces lateritius]
MLDRGLGVFPRTNIGRTKGAARDQRGHLPAPCAGGPVSGRAAPDGRPGRRARMSDSAPEGAEVSIRHLYDDRGASDDLM